MPPCRVARIPRVSPLRGSRESSGIWGVVSYQAFRTRKNMSRTAKSAQQSQPAAGFLSTMWKHRLWWMLPLAVLLLLLGAIYALEHLSKTDSEMYPTSSRLHVRLPYSG